MRFFATILLAAMVLNIGKYQFPYIEYYLFKNYIAKNLCVKRNEAYNCCQGKCHLVKQIKQVNKTEDTSSNPIEKKLSNNWRMDDYIVSKIIFQSSDSFIKMQLSIFTAASIVTTDLAVPVPPPKRFI